MKSAGQSTFNRPLTILNGLLFLVWVVAMVSWVCIEHLRYEGLAAAQQEQQQNKATGVIARSQEEAQAVAHLLRSNQLVVRSLPLADLDPLLDTIVPMLQLPYVQLINLYQPDGRIAAQAHQPTQFGQKDALEDWLHTRLIGGKPIQTTAAVLSQHKYLLTAARIEDMNGLAGYVVVGTLLEGSFQDKLQLATGVKAEIHLESAAADAAGQDSRTPESDTTRQTLALSGDLSSAGLRIDLVDPVNELRQTWRRSFYLGLLGLLVAGAFLLAVAAISSRSLGRSERQLRQALDAADAASQFKGELLVREEDQHRRQDLIIRCSGVGSYEWDARIRKATYSPRLIEMLGYPPDTDTSGWRAEERIDPRDRNIVAARFSSLTLPRLETGAVSQIQPSDFRLLRQDGTPLWVHGDAVVVRDNNGTAQQFLASFIDITPILAAEEDTRTALARQQQLNELRTRFVAMTSHEFRTPLATILSSAELLKYYDARLPAAEKASIIGTIEEGVQRMKRMLDKILNIGKAEAGMLEFNPTPIDLRAVCQAIVDNAKLQRPQSVCTVVTDFGFGASEGVFDEQLLRHIFDNLLSNALKYSPQGGEVRFSVRREGAAMVFQVSDQGIGIPQDELGDLFASFHRASNVGDIQGTGLGLAIVKNSVDLHGGDITATCPPSGGTCFTVRL
ncbi:MAG: PAS domain-containing sensor histidine kinase [Pseudomonadota bacterium]